MAEFAYVTQWRLEAPIAKVWDAIYHSERWPTWWKNVKNVDEVERGQVDGVGNVRHYVWKGKLPYRIRLAMRTTRVEPLVALEGLASGDVEGAGRWRFSTDGPITAVRYDWTVRTTKLWMNVLAPLARPLIDWNHDGIMQEGGAALARLLNATLIEASHG